MSAEAPLPSFAGAAFLAQPAFRRVVAALAVDGDEVRLVGGSVRDAVLAGVGHAALQEGDLDLATTATPDVVSARARAAGLKVVPTGIAHGTVTVVVDRRPFEVTTLRRDVATDGRHAEVAFGRDWTEDARRRDFTMNAMSLSPDGVLHDPVGGHADCLARRVRFIGVADERIREDYLRILRFFRFHARFGSGEPDAEGLHAVTRNLDGLPRLSAERIAQEMRKLVVAPGAAETLASMAECGVLDRVLAGVPRLGRFARFAAICRAGGADVEPSPALVALAVFVAEDAGRLAARLKLSGAERERMVAAEAAVRPLSRAGATASGDVTADAAAARVLLYRLGAAAWRDGTRLAWADAGAAADDAVWHARLTLPDRWPPPRLPVAGRDLLNAGVAPGPEVGRRLAALEARWIASDFALTRAELLAER